MTKAEVPTYSDLSPQAQRIVTICWANTTWYCEVRDSWREESSDLSWVTHMMNEDPEEEHSGTYTDEHAEEAAEFLAGTEGWSATDEEDEGEGS